MSHHEAEREARQKEQDLTSKYWGESPFTGVRAVSDFDPYKYFAEMSRKRDMERAHERQVEKMLMFGTAYGAGPKFFSAGIAGIAGDTRLQGNEETLVVIDDVVKFESGVMKIFYDVDFGVETTQKDRRLLLCK